MAIKGSSLILPLALALAALPAAAGEITTSIRNVRPQQGLVMVALFDSADGYTADRRFAGQQLAPVAAGLTAVFAGLPPGRYAIAVYQDLDGDGKLGRTLLGIPTEPYGFGGDVAGTFGPPAFEAMAVAVGDGATPVTVTLTP